MFSFNGNITGSAVSQALQLGSKIISFSLVDKSGSSNTVNVTVGGISIVATDLAIASNAIYESERIIYMEIGEQISVESSGSLDYFFTLDNVEV